MKSSDPEQPVIKQPSSKQDWRAMRWLLLILFIMLIGGLLGDIIRGDNAFAEGFQEGRTWARHLLGR
jgi:hypothetical protein